MREEILFRSICYPTIQHEWNYFKSGYNYALLSKKLILSNKKSWVYQELYSNFIHNVKKCERYNIEDKMALSIFSRTLFCLKRRNEIQSYLYWIPQFIESKNLKEFFRIWKKVGYVLKPSLFCRWMKKLLMDISRVKFSNIIGNGNDVLDFENIFKESNCHPYAEVLPEKCISSFAES